jgi:hypothetical protein
VSGEAELLVHPLMGAPDAAIEPTRVTALYRAVELHWRAHVHVARLVLAVEAVALGNQQ